MSNRDKTLRFLFGIGLALATIATRFPIRARTFFEFDSINFAIGAIRFDLSQVTPQMPGYILHVLFGRGLYALTGDLHQAYIWLSILLSIASVLFLWRAAAVLRGERVGVMAALLWLTLPLFWFHGAVDAIYAEEACWASILLYIGLKLITNYEVRSGNREQRSYAIFVILIAVGFSLAGAARPNDLLFFLPGVLYVLWKAKPSTRLLISGVMCFLAITTVWVLVLLRESGGLAHYLALAETESNFKTQSVLFGNSWQSQLDLIGKVLFYLVMSPAPMWIVMVTLSFAFPRRFIVFVQQCARNSKARVVFLFAAAPLAFYLIVFFMKAGYLLNVLPSVILVGAVFLDQAAIWLAEHTKRRHRLQLTRPIITRYSLCMTGTVVLLNILWFFVSWPGTQQRLYNNEDTRNSFIHGALQRYEHSESPLLTLANRAFEYTNISGIRAVDSLDDAVLITLKANHGNDSGTVILASWWYRWAYIKFPHTTVYDLELNPNHQGPLDVPNDSLWVGRSHEIYRVFLDQLGDSTIHLNSRYPILLLLRHDRPDFDTVAKQVHLERLPMPQYLDIYRILDTNFILHWHHRTFISSAQ